MNSDKDNLHLRMHANPKHRIRLADRFANVKEAMFGRNKQYGLAWGDPEILPPLKYIRNQYVLPFVNENTIVVEIGPGGGRWTRYLLAAKKIYGVDLFPELLAELKQNIQHKDLVLVKNEGADFPGIADKSVDFVFSFGVFVHLEQNIIRQYLDNIRKIIKPNGVAVIQYSDKNKPLAKSNAGFTQNDPETMRRMVKECGFQIQAEDTLTLWHSAVIQFGI